MPRRKKGVVECWLSGGMNQDGSPCRNKAVSKDGRCKRHEVELPDLLWPDVKHPRQRAFLEHFRRRGNQARACKAVGTTRTRIKDWRDKDEAFAAAYEEARQMSADQLEHVARRLATGEIRQYKFDVKGQPLRHPVTGEPYYEEVYDTRMISFLHKIVRPEAHRTDINLTALGISTSDLPDEALERLIAGEDPVAIIADSLRRLRQLEEANFVVAETEDDDGEDGEYYSLPGPSSNGHTNGKGE